MSNLQCGDSAVLHEDVVRSMPEAVVFSDLQGLIRIWNPGAEAVFGFTAEEALGQNLDLIIPERLRQAHWDGFNKAVARGFTEPGKPARITRALHKRGEPIYVDMSFAMVTSQSGVLLGALAVARDATARFLAEKELRRQVAELTARLAAHDA